MKRHALRLSLISLLVVFTSACAPLVDVDAPSRSELQAVLDPPAAVPPEMLSGEALPMLELSGEMERFVATVVPPDGNVEQKLDALYQTLRSNPSYFIEYESQATLTAADAFRERRANCLAFSAMFIAMARHAGLPADFQEVDVPPSWDSQDDDTMVQYRHVNVNVKLSRRVNGVIDFRGDRYSETYPKRVISDREALAHYYSNISMDHMLAGRLEEAFVAARRGIEADASQAFLWNNMGIIQRRLGNVDEAATSFRQALSIDPRDWAAVGNLSHVLAQQGDAEGAARLRALGDQIKLRNPYYRYALAQRAYRLGAYGEALDQLDAAVGRKRNEPRFYYLRGLSQWQLGDTDSAIDDVKRAIRIASEDDSLVRYQRQLEEWQDNRG